MKRWVHAATLSAQKDNLEKIAAPASQWEKSYDRERQQTFWSKDFADGHVSISDWDDDGEAWYEVRIDINGGDWNVRNGGETLYRSFNYFVSDDPLKDAKAWADKILKERGYE